MPTESDLKTKLQQEFEPDHLEVSDLSDGCGAKFHLVVVSAKFDGKPLLERHRMVNSCLSAEMPQIHALTMKTMTPEQWQKLQQK